MTKLHKLIILFFIFFFPVSLFSFEAFREQRNRNKEPYNKNLNIMYQAAFPALVFNQPVDLQNAGDGSNRIFVVEQPGRILVFENNPAVEQASVFLDITKDVFSGHSEEGLLGLAFHPRYRENGYFYVDYTANNPRRTVIARFKVSKNDKNKADPASKRVFLEVPQPYGNHNGGQIAFGLDGFLYISFGDGGSGGDPHGNGQNRSVWLGKMLRIDVDRAEGDRQYRIPSDNPFAGNKEDFKEEIFAYGLRNVWRFSFDSVTGWLWAGDVGQDKPNEEIDIIQNGKNYGWNIMEGFDCYEPPVGCNEQGLEKPIWQYTSDMGRSITGGHVYRGKRLPSLYGKYVYGDFVAGRVWSLEHVPGKSPVNTLLFHNSNLYISSFGADEDKELYFCSFDGKIYTLLEEGSN